MLDRLKGLIRLRLVRNVLALFSTRTIDQLLPLLVVPYLARVLGPSGWGLVAFAQAFAVYGIATVEYGFGLAGTREVARGRDVAARLPELVTGIFASQVLLASGVALAALAVQVMVPSFHDDPALLWSAAAFGILQGLHPMWYFAGQERIPLIATIGVGSKLLATIAILVVVRDQDDGWLVLACYAGGAFLAAGLGYALILREVRPGRLSVALIGRTLRLGASMFVMRMAVLMHTAGNAFLLGLLVVPQQVAFFAAGEKLCRPAAWLLHPINVALLPRLSNLVGHSPDKAGQLAGVVLLLVGAIGIGFGLSIAVLAPWLVVLLFGPQYDAAVTVLRVMAVIVPLIVINAALVAQWLIPHGMDRAINVVTIAGTLLNLILALLIAPFYGALGMAWVTVMVEGVILIGLLAALHRRGLRPLVPSQLRRGLHALVADRR